MVTLNLDTSRMKLEDYKKKIIPAIKAGLWSGSQVILNESKRIVPVLSGTLKRSLHVEEKAEKQGYYNQVGTNLDYAKKIEYGTSAKAPEGYLRISLDTKQREAIDEIKNAIKSML